MAANAVIQWSPSGHRHEYENKVLSRSERKSCSLDPSTPSDAFSRHAKTKILEEGITVSYYDDEKNLQLQLLL